MNRRPQISKKLETEISILLRASREFSEKGDFEVAIKYLLKSWEILPEPKENWDFFPDIISKGLIELYGKSKNSEYLKIWIDKAHLVYSDPEKENVALLFLAGKSYLECEEPDHAKASFQKIYDLHGDRWFIAEHKTYLDYVNMEQK